MPQFYFALPEFKLRDMWNAMVRSQIMFTAVVMSLTSRSLALLFCLSVIKWEDIWYVMHKNQTWFISQKKKIFLEIDSF
jgi:hypothetical protein